jgi:hypothetical protein
MSGAIDNCRNPEDGIIESDIYDLIRYFNSYTEISPSGSGIRIFVKATLPPYGRKKGNFEVYKSGRYLTLTGHHIDPAPMSIKKRWVKNAEYHSKIFGQNDKSSAQKLPPTDHREILKKAFGSKNGHEIRRLYSGDTAGYASPSEADLALCSHLAFWFNKDMERIDHVFRSSVLYRKKWDEKRGDKTYGEKTMQLACDSCTKTFQEYQSTKTKDLGVGQKVNQSLISYESITARDLMKAKLPEPKWAVPEILPEGLNMLVGKPKRGKSILVYNIGVAIASGGKASGQIKVSKGTVLYFALEDTRRRLQHRLNMMLPSGSIAPSELHLYTHCPRMEQGGLKFLENEILKYPEIRLIIIDTFARFRPFGKRSSNRLYDIDYNEVVKVKDIADRHTVSILLVLHQRKGNDDDVIESISGTLGLGGAADGVLGLIRDIGQADAKLLIVGRDVEEAEYALKFNPSYLLWEMLGKTQDVKSTEMRQTLYDAIKNSKESVSPKRLSETTGLTRKYVQRTLPSLINEGNIKKVGRGKYMHFNTVVVLEKQEQQKENPVSPKRRRRRRISSTM